MSTSLPITLSDSAFTALAGHAAEMGTTPDELASAVVESAYGGKSVESRDAVVARARFERCFGSVDMGRPVGIANAAIDADLAQAYLNAANDD